MKNANSAPQTLLVTGGAGFIGFNFILYWLENHPDDHIINLDALTYAGNPDNLKLVGSRPNHHFVHGDICDPQLVDRVMADADVVVHFAAESHVDRSIIDPAIFVKTNVLGTQVLLEAAVKHQLKRFHHISTDEVFGSLELGSTLKFSNQTPYDPRSPYSASKAGSDHLVRAYGETYGLHYSITNCSNNYGEFQFPEKMIPLAITNLLENKQVPVYGDGLNVRDWLYVQDHCRAIDLILQTDPAQSTYLIGGLTHDVSNLELVKMIIKLMDKSEDQLEFVQDRSGHDRRYSVDWSQINHDLGWQPQLSLEEGLTQTIKWYQDHPRWWQPLKKREGQFFSQNYHGKVNTY